MKKILITTLLIAAVIVPMVYPPFTAEADITSDLVAHWAWDASSSDSSGNGNDATQFGEPVYVSSPKIIGSYAIDLELDTADYFTTTLTSGSTFTWSAWIYAESFSTYHSILTIQAPNYMLFDVDASGNLSIWSSEGGFAGNNLGITGLSTGTWYHLALVREGDSTANGMKAYLNGTFMGAGNTGVWSSSDVIYIGGRQDAGTQLFDGVIDDTRVYSRALSAGDIEELYELGYPPTPPAATDGGTLILFE